MPTIEFRDDPTAPLYAVRIYRDGMYFGTIWPDVHSMRDGDPGHYWVSYDLRATVQVILSYPVADADGIASYPGDEVSYWVRPNEVTKSVKQHAQLEYRPF